VTGRLGGACLRVPPARGRPTPTSFARGQGGGQTGLTEELWPGPEGDPLPNRAATHPPHDTHLGMIHVGRPVAPIGFAAEACPMPRHQGTWRRNWPDSGRERRTGPGLRRTRQTEDRAFGSGQRWNQPWPWSQPDQRSMLGRVAPLAGVAPRTVALLLGGQPMGPPARSAIPRAAEMAAPRATGPSSAAVSPAQHPPPRDPRPWPQLSRVLLPARPRPGPNLLARQPLDGGVDNLVRGDCRYTPGQEGPPPLPADNAVGSVS